MQKIKILFALAALCCVCAFQLYGGDKELDKSYRKAAKHYGFTIKTEPKFHRGVKGSILPVASVEPDLNRFFEALGELGESFVKKSGLSRVIICSNLTLHGMPCAGVASGNTMYLSKGFSKKTVYHEMFHIFDKHSDDKDWQRCNHERFIYRGIDFQDKPLSKNKKKKLEKNRLKYNIDFSGDFITDYAQSDEKEDRAETFAYMIAHSKMFWQRAIKNRALWMKMRYIIEMTSRNSLLGKDYWVKKFGPAAMNKKFPGTVPNSYSQK